NPTLLYHHFAKAGRYLVEVAGENSSYLLRIAAADPSRQQTVLRRDGKTWQERAFSRAIEPRRIPELWARTVRTRATASVLPENQLASGPVPKSRAAEEPEIAASDPQPPTSVEKEPNDSPAQAVPVPIPTIIEG